MDIVERLREFVGQYLGNANLDDELTEATNEIVRLRSGINALVNCQSQLTRAQMKEAAAELLSCKTWGTRDQSPFITQNGILREEIEQLREEVKAYKDNDYHQGRSDGESVGYRMGYDDGYKEGLREAGKD